MGDFCGKPVEKFADNILEVPEVKVEADALPKTAETPEVPKAPEAPKPVEPPKENLAVSSKGDGLFTLDSTQKATLLKHIEDNAAKGNLDELFEPANGAFNYRKMDSPVEVKSTIEAMANILKPALDKNVGEVQTFSQIKSLAGLVGSKPEQMVANLKTWGIDEERF